MSEKNIEVWNVDTTWLNYGLTQESIKYNGEPTGQKMIVRDGEYLAMVSDRYYLFPHQEALKAADAAAKMVGLEQFVMDTPGVTNRGHVSYDDKEKRMKAFYGIDGMQKIDGDNVKVGIQIYNSIDGSRGFGAGLFTYRSICGNGVIYGKKDLISIMHKHTLGLDAIVKGLQSTMLKIMEKAHGIVDEYRRMTQEHITVEMVNKLNKATFIPKSVLPDSLKVPAAELEDLSQWNVYNDITEAIWHNTKSGLKTKELQFGDLHRVMLAPRLRRI